MHWTLRLLLGDDRYEALADFDSFLKAFPTSVWQGWGSPLRETPSEQFQSASVSQDGVGIAILIERSKSEGLLMQAAYPILVDGEPAEVELLDTLEDEDLACAGALHMLTQRGTQLEAFDPDYADHQPLLRPGGHYLADLGALVSDLSPMESSFEITQGPLLEIQRAMRKEKEPDVAPADLSRVTISNENLRSFQPSEEPLWYTFVTKVENLRAIEFFGDKGWMFEGTVESDESRSNLPPLKLRFMVMDHATSGYVPREGALVVGSAFLEVQLKQPLPYEGTPWADRPGDSDYLLEDMFSALRAGDSWNGAPPAVQVTAQLLSQNGWNVSSPESWNGPMRLHPPLLKVQRGDETHLIGLQVNGDEPPSCDLVLRVLCQREGEGHEVKLEAKDATVIRLQLRSLGMWCKDGPSMLPPG
ncbi:hypothetical protein DES53_107203 [Roseimicrobium gellanilyticum]|uniref:Uncharacterized protein n=1 Tax=Roseimicrobium gellanilyticum TaxID=748857 RepID=A0A366HFN0_9BACT|nr:hypothetical protein [Roseimicrobium gellanilyticum]RBP41372.1 hypothetical protein DES53_107203 [Roseimicrobium gellanilyticum]